MNIPGSNSQLPLILGAASSALEGLRTQEQSFERNVIEVVQLENSNTQDTNNRDRALIEQKAIVQAVQANARSLEAANQIIGTLIDIKV